MNRTPMPLATRQFYFHGTIQISWQLTWYDNSSHSFFFRLFVEQHRIKCTQCSITFKYNFQACSFIRTFFVHWMPFFLCRIGAAVTKPHHEHFFVALYCFLIHIFSSLRFLFGVGKNKNHIFSSLVPTEHSLDVFFSCVFVVDRLAHFFSWLPLELLHSLFFVRPFISKFIGLNYK